MEDYLLISLCESVGFLFLWPRMVEKTTDWSSKSLQKNNPHLRICYYARKWITPFLFVVLSSVAISFGMDLAKEFVEIVVLNLVVLATTLLLGTLASQYVIEHYMTGRKHFF